jgi:hypothetical protein
MSSKRTPINRPPRGWISPAAIAAWQACDWEALHCALHLEAHEPSPLPLEISRLGVSPDLPPDPNDGRGWDRADPKILALQHELLQIVGWPDCREAYERNLRNAEEARDYCAELVRHPGRGGQGTGCDLPSRRRDLQEARDEVAYRKKLLAELAAREPA